MVYGYDTLEDDDPFIFAAHKVLVNGGRATEPGYLVELLPWRKPRDSYLLPMLFDFVCVLSPLRSGLDAGCKLHT